MKKAYSYKYPHPAVTTDIVVFTMIKNSLRILLIERGVEPFKNKWALPGGFVKSDEGLEDCARRELAEETGATGIELHQIKAFGSPNRDPRERVISISFYALIKSDLVSIKAGSDANKAKWFKFSQLPELAFDHENIIQNAYWMMERSLEVRYGEVNIFSLLDEEFTIPELQRIYEAILQRTLDRRNFSKKIKDIYKLKDTNKLRKDGPYRPSKVYSLYPKN